MMRWLLLLPQRYIFSSKSQRCLGSLDDCTCCCCYHKGTYFQANHNCVRLNARGRRVVVATTKVHIFKQITTMNKLMELRRMLLLLPQRYIFSSKSQHIVVMCRIILRCCCYHKGTYFQANHNSWVCYRYVSYVVVATTKVHIFKQITTGLGLAILKSMLLLLPQRYIFSSKSQPCSDVFPAFEVVVATTKVHIFKQITTSSRYCSYVSKLLLLPQRYIFSSKSQLASNMEKRPSVLLLLPQRYIFSSKSQPIRDVFPAFDGCCCYHKGTYFQANHNAVCI